MPFIVKTSAEKMPQKCWGHYRRVAVLHVLPGVTDVRMISERARGVVAIVHAWERLSAPPGARRSAYVRALDSARALADALNAGATYDQAWDIADRVEELVDDGLSFDRAYAAACTRERVPSEI